MEELIEKCLKKYDKTHKNKYEEYKGEIISKLFKALGNPTNINYKCTEDPRISGTSPRVDAYIDTGTNKYALEVKLCLDTGVSLTKNLFKKVIKTLENLKINDMITLIIIVPKDHLENAKNNLIKYITYTTNEYIAYIMNKNIKLGPNDFIIQHQIEGPLIAIRPKRYYTDYLKMLHEYRIKEIALLPI
jgi:hypothetical protein